MSWHVQTGAAALLLVYIPEANSRKALGTWIDFMGAQVKWRHTQDRSFPSWVQGSDRQLIELVQNITTLEKVCVCVHVCVLSLSVKYLPQQK